MNEQSAPGREIPASTSSQELRDARELAASHREMILAQRESDLERREAALREAEQRMSELRDANEHLVMATLAAEQMEEAALRTKRQQDEFLAMLAHELRNPLAPIRSAVSLLERLDSGDSSVAKIHQIVSRQVEHMARLLDDLLDASRVSSGKVTLRRQPTDIRDFVEQAVEVCAPLIAAQKQFLSLDLPTEAVFVDGDPTRLGQVVGNLLHNAAKYTSPGGAIGIKAYALADSVVLQVIDNGIGISPPALKHVFDLFAQEERSLSRSQGGLGIGLTVVRGMVQQHGGTVSVKSAGLGKGSEFTVMLPRLLGFEQPQAGPAEKAGFAPGRILVVDDNVDAASMLQALLQLSGCEVEVVHDGPAALLAFEQRPFPIVLCDIGLPLMDGYEVARRIRKLPAGQQGCAFLVALTGYDAAEDRTRAIVAGFDRHFAKPVDFDLLLKHLNEAPCSTESSAQNCP